MAEYRETMPKIGPYRYPTHAIDAVVDLIDEAGNRVQVQEETISEDTFQQDVIDRAGGTYSRYRASLKQYGFIERERGADEVKITDLFVHVADPLDAEDRENAISRAVENIDFFAEMYEAGFGPEFTSREFRKWLIEEKGVLRKNAEPDTIEDLRKKYAIAFEYFSESEKPTEEEQEKQNKSDEEHEADSPGENGQQAKLPLSDNKNPDGEVEEIRVGNRAVVLPKENIEREWHILRATVNAYVESLSDED